MLGSNFLVCGPNLLGSESSAVFALGRIFLGPNLLPTLSSAVFQISSGIRGRPAENGSGSNRMKKVPSSKSRRSAKVQIEGATSVTRLHYGSFPFTSVVGSESRPSSRGIFRHMTVTDFC